MSDTRHDLNSIEVEAFLYMTGLFVRLIIETNKHKPARSRELRIEIPCEWRSCGEQRTQFYSCKRGRVEFTSVGLVSAVGSTGKSACVTTNGLTDGSDRTAASAKCCGGVLCRLELHRLRCLPANCAGHISRSWR